jgi:hypothetical protein
MRKENNIPEIRAELLLNYLYPEGGNQWIAQNEGLFFRNYNSDLLAIDEKGMVVETARDSFMKLLPQGLLTQETDLKGEDAAEKFKQLEKRLRLLRETFKPIDTFRFRESVYVEHQIDSLLQEKLSYILKEYFGVDLDKIENHYVREVACLLPYVSRRRGDFGFIASLLRTLLKCKVYMTTGRYSHSDSTISWRPMIRYELDIPGLTPEEFRKMDKEIEPLREFLYEWLIPVEVWCQIVIKEHNVPQQANMRLTLGYNTEVKVG